MKEANYCDRLLIMVDGELLAQGTPVQMEARFRTDSMPSPAWKVPSSA